MFRAHNIMTFMCTDSYGTRYFLMAFYGMFNTETFQNGQKIEKIRANFHWSPKQQWFQVKGFSWNWKLLNCITWMLSISNYIQISHEKLKITARTSVMPLSNKEWLSLHWLWRKSYLVHSSFENNYMDFHENLMKSAVANAKLRQMNGHMGGGLNIRLFSCFVKDASKLILLLFHNTDL